MPRDAPAPRKRQIVLEIAGEVVGSLATASGKAIARAGHTFFDALQQRIGSIPRTLASGASAGLRQKRSGSDRFASHLLVQQGESGGFSPPRLPFGHIPIVGIDSRPAGIVEDDAPVDRSHRGPE